MGWGWGGNGLKGTNMGTYMYLIPMFCGKLGKLMGEEVGFLKNKGDASQNNLKMMRGLTLGFDLVDGLIPCRIFCTFKD